MKYLAILGGHALACQAISRIKTLGYDILLLDRHTEAAAKTLASRFLNVDFMDEVKTLSALRGLDIIGVMPLNDFGIRTASAVAAGRGLPGWSRISARLLTNKVAMKKAWDAAGVPIPKFAYATRSQITAGQFPEWSRFPCIVKPAFSGGGSRGVTLASNWDDVRIAVQKSWNDHLDEEVLLEEYVEGTEHQINALIHNGKALLLHAGDKQNYPGSVSIVQRHDFPGPIIMDKMSIIEPLIQKACDALLLTNGTTHFEIILKGGNPYFLEVGGRPGGGPHFHPICHVSSGIDYPMAYAQVLTGTKPDMRKSVMEHVVWWHFSAKPGRVLGIRGLEAVYGDPDVIDFQIYHNVGSILPEMNDDLARPGFILIKGRTRDDATRKAATYASKIFFDTEMQG